MRRGCYSACGTLNKPWSTAGMAGDTNPKKPRFDPIVVAAGIAAVASVATPIVAALVR